ncbi:hypothetical protein ACWGE0_37625 [Lentzea sp. NPDC054927]
MNESDQVRNEIADNAVIIGPVVQTGTFSGQIHHHAAPRQPLDLLTLRQWVEHIAAGQDQHARQLDQVRAAVADPSTADAVRRLMIAGMVGYLARPGAPPDRPVAAQIVLDLVVFALWPVVTAKKLPPGWEGQLAQLTSPRLAVLVQRAREQPPAPEEFARTLASRSFTSATAMLFDDLADPRRGGALLTAMALAGGLEAPPTARGAGRKVAVWALVIAGGATLAHALRHTDSRATRILGEVMVDLATGPGDPLDLTDVAADLVDWLFG